MGNNRVQNDKAVITSEMSVISQPSPTEILKTVLESLDAIVYVADLDTYEIIFANRYLRENFGAVPGKLCWQTIQHSSTGPCGFCPNDKLLDRNGEPGDMYRWEQLNTVDKRWYDTIDRAIYWPDGRIVRLTIATDITARKIMEESLHETNEKLNTILRYSPNIIEVIDNKYTIIYTNEIIKDSAPKTVIGRSVFENMEESYHQKFKNAFKKVIDNQKTVTFQFEGLKGRWWESEIAPIRINTETECVMLITREITRRKLMEESLIESNEKLYTLLKNSPDTILVIDRDFDVLYSNETMQEPRDKQRNKKNVLNEIKPAYHESFKEVFWRVVEKKEADSFEFEDRKGNWWESRIAQITISLDSKCVMVINRDISDRKKVENFRKQAQLELEQRIQERTEELEQTYQQLIQRDKMATLGFMVSSIAHEINNPNSFISFNIPILHDYISDVLPVLDHHSKEIENYEICGIPYDEFRDDILNLLENMKHGSQRITDTVANLKDFIGSQQEKEFRLTDLNSLIEKGVELCGNKVKSMVRTFEVDVPDDSIDVYTIPQSLEQILINLLVNAAQSADKPDSWVKLVVNKETAEEDWISIEIRDNGCGIETENLPRIFDPFFTTKKKMAGLGLGLNITKKLTEEIGGIIDVESEPGVGSCFRLSIPLTREESGQD